ncbi:MAG: DUF3822 family protein [Bacteroidales bacterium]|jgi:hypothetical protein|nr:DUF3822 family protein [Bacteroidales bacterium]
MVSYFVNNQVIAENLYSDDCQKKLSICLETNGFSFTVINADKKMLAFGDIVCNFPNTLSQIISLIKQIFSDLRVDFVVMDEVELIVMSNKYTWIPGHLFEASHAREYFNLVTPLEVRELVCHDYSEKIQAYSVFAYADTIISAFKVAIPGIKIRSQQSKMVESSLLDRSKSKSVIYVYVSKKSLDVCVFSNKNFVLSNSYVHETTDDIVYYLLLIERQLNLNSENVEVHISGDIDRKAFTYMEKFFNKLFLYSGNDSVSFSADEMYKIPLYKYSLFLG